MGNRNPALPVGVAPQDLSGERVEAADAAAARASAHALAGRDHDQMILAADFDDGRADVSGAARECRRLPFQRTRQLVICDNARSGCLRCHDHQVAVDQGILCQRPPRQLSPAEVLPDVPVPDGFVRARADAIQVSQRAAGVDVVAVNHWRGSRSGMIERARRAVREAPQLLAGGKVEASNLVPDRVVPVEQVHLAGADRRTAVADANGGRPEDPGPFLRPGSQKSLFRRSLSRFGPRYPGQSAANTHATESDTNTAISPVLGFIVIAPPLSSQNDTSRPGNRIACWFACWFAPGPPHRLSRATARPSPGSWTESTLQ